MRSCVSDEGRVYIQTDSGLWVRSVIDYAKGVVCLQWQPKLNFDRGVVRITDLNGRVTTEPYQQRSETLTQTWSEGAELAMDSTQFFKTETDIRDQVFVGVMRHSAALLASGYGEGEDEVMSWFSDLSKLEFLESNLSYEVIRGVDPTSFLVHGPVTLGVQDGAIDCTVEINGESHSVRIDAQQNPAVWALRATIPRV